MPVTPNCPQEDAAALFPTLVLFARRFVNNTTDAEDLAQETLAKMLGNLHHFQPGTSMKSWAFTILRNTAMNEYAKRNRLLLRSEDDSLNIPMQETQLIEVHARDVGSAMSRLPACQRDALRMVVDGLSYDEMARNFRCEMGTVKSRISRARSALAALLGETISSASSVH